MKTRTIAVVGSIAALSLAAAPIAGAASTHSRSIDTKRDHAHHVDRSPDLKTHEVRDR